MLSDLYFRQKRLLVLTLGVIIVAGIGALNTIERQEDPALSRRFADIVTRYPGATAERVETLISEPLETQLQEIHEIATIESFSRTGQSVVNIELEEEYTEEYVDEIWSRVRDKIADVEATFPDGATTPIFNDRSSTAVTLLIGLTWAAEGEPELSLLTRLAEELENRLIVLPGTQETELYGAAEEEIRVTVDPLRLAEVNLGAQQIAAAIAAADTRRPAGEMQQSEARFPLEVEGQLADIDRIREIPLRLGPEGRVLRLGALAQVEKTRADPPRSMAILSGERGVAVSATMLPGTGRVDVWAAGARRVLSEFQSELPDGIRAELLFDQSEYTAERLEALVGNLLFGSAIVVGVLFIMMGPRSAVVVASILPLTLLTVLILLLLLGIPLHQISVTGLIVALGLLIDNAIVVVDEYQLRLKRGDSPGEAIRHVVGDLFVPLGASTLTTVLAFMPIALLPGGGGEFVGTIGVGVILSVVSSYLISMTIILAFAGHLMPEASAATGYTHPGLRDLYRRSIVRILERPAIGVAIGVALPLLGFAVAGGLSQSFFPANDRNQFQVQIDLPGHYSLEATRKVSERVRAIVESHEEVVTSHWFVGDNAPRVFYGMLGNYEIPNYAGGFVVTQSPIATENVLPKLQEELRRAVPEALVLVLPFEQGPPVDAPIEIRVVGPNLDELRRLGDEVRLILGEADGVTYTRAKLLGGRPKLAVRADEDALSQAGLRLGDVADQLSASLEGAVGGRVIEATEEIPIRVRVGGADRASIERIASSRLIAPGQGGADASGAAPRGDLAGIPIGAIGEIALVPELGAIMRRNGERLNTVQAFLEPYHLIQDSLDDFNRRLEESGFEAPPGYTIGFGGDFEERSDATSSLAAFAVPLFIMMGAAIILTFNSFRLAAIIFGVALLSVGLALLSVWIFDYPMGFVVIVGTMGLVGLAINDAIVVLNALVLDERASEADPEPTADVILDATRHIVATTLTTVGGFLPLILFGGRFWPPMATAISGGVLGASILALYFVPALFALTRRSKRSRRARAEQAAALTPEPA